VAEWAPGVVGVEEWSEDDRPQLTSIGRGPTSPPRDPVFPIPSFASVLVESMMNPKEWGPWLSAGHDPD